MLRRLLDVAAAAALLTTGSVIVAGAVLWRRPRARRVTVYGREGERVAYRVIRLFRRGHALWPLNYLLVLLPVIRGQFAFTGSRIAWVGRYTPVSAAEGVPSAAESRRRELLRQIIGNARSRAVMTHYARTGTPRGQCAALLRLHWRTFLCATGITRLFARRPSREAAAFATAAALARAGEPRRSRTASREAVAPAVPPYAWNKSAPGLLSPYVLQRRANLRSDGPDGADARFSFGVPLKAHAALVARFALSLVLGAAPRRIPPKVNLLDVEIANISMAAALDRLVEMARGDRLQQVAFVNADCLNIAVRDPAYRDLLGGPPLVLADGIGIRQALKWFAGVGLKENVNGTDLFPQLCITAAANGLSLYLLGARPGVAAGAAEAARKLAPALRIAGARDGYFSSEEAGAVIEEINASGADIVLVAMGVPAQEFWIRSHAAALRCGVAIGVGGLFDFYSGRIARAPLWMREIGLEWVYRLMQEPGRMWRRYLVGNPLFLWRAWHWSRARARNAERARAGVLARSESPR
ncbi:MAG: WecB/TagA/CpsF family glycosyltransferase [Betaproteobacteria bacterium]|nr:WecB/TagA/CpsF family glycosyltransferase [Betaproteobacteria bacterium]